MEDDNTFFANLADNVNRNKSKTDYMRRQSSEIGQNENTPVSRVDEFGNDAIIEQSVEETQKESMSVLMEQHDNAEQFDNDIFFKQLKPQ